MWTSVSLCLSLVYVCLFLSLLRTPLRACRRTVDEFLASMQSQCVRRERQYIHQHPQHHHRPSSSSSSSGSLSAYRRLRRFMHLWTVKESFVKALGTGAKEGECRGDLGGTRRRGGMRALHPARIPQYMGVCMRMPLLVFLHVGCVLCTGVGAAL